MARMVPVWMQHSSSMTAGTLALTVLCIPAPAAGMGWDGMDAGGNRSVQSGTLEAAVLAWGSGLSSPATPELPFHGTVLWQPVGRGPLC